jgi:hypothetical protein
MTVPAYPAARQVAAQVHERLAQRAVVRQGDEGPFAAVPDPATIEAVIDAAFWASLRREEDHIPKISLALLPAGQAPQPLLLERALPLNPNMLVRLAPAVERPGIHLGIWPVEGQLMLWGIARTLPPHCLVVEVVAPGLLVVKYPRGGDGSKFVNMAVLEADQIKIISEEVSGLADSPPLLTLLSDCESSVSSPGSVDVLTELAASMRGHERGGTLLVAPAGTDRWRESIVTPIPYAVSPAYCELAELMREGQGDKHQLRWQEDLNRAVSALAGLTAVDGATVITDRFELLAFGATIARRDGGTPVERVALTEPILGGVSAVVHPGQLGGTRHLSAAQFAQDQRDSVALVASQDGRFTLFSWSPCKEMVHAHRVETLLL